MSQFDNFDPNTHEDRIKRIKTISKKDYIDEGPVALYHLLHLSRANGHHLIVEFSLRELERLYGLKNEGLAR